MVEWRSDCGYGFQGGRSAFARLIGLYPTKLVVYESGSTPHHVAVVRECVEHGARELPSDDVIAALRPLLVAGGALPHPPGYRLEVLRREPLTFDVAGNAGPLVTCALALSPLDSALAWRALTEVATKVACPMPAAPWLGVAIHPALARDLSASAWLGDLERCVAWAWIEGVR